MPDLRKLSLEDRKKVLNEWFRHHLRCEHNLGGGYRRMDKRYVAEVKAFYSQRSKCGLHIVRQTRGNTILLTPTWKIESYLIFDDSFNDLYKIITGSTPSIVSAC